MNAFQKQLLLKGNKSMAELSNPERDGIGQPLPPVSVSMEEWYAGAPNRFCEECRRLGICAYHRDFPHNLRSRKD